MSPPPGHGQIHFTDVTQDAGIRHLHQFPTLNHESSWIVGGGVAEDFDGDGWIDLYTLQGNSHTNALYMNLGDGTFTNEAQIRGVALQGNYSGAAAADYDNDGDIDMCVTRLALPPLLLKNDGTGHFTVISSLLTLPSGPVMSPSWGDVNNDGFLELAIGKWDVLGEPLVLYLNDEGQLRRYNYLHVPFQNTFVFAPRFADVNNDGFADLLVVSDFNRSQMYTNDGTGMFVRVTDFSGVGTDENGMGSAVGDYDNDGDLDWFVSSIWDDAPKSQGNWGDSGNRMYRNNGDGTFVDATDATGVRNGNWGWGSVFGDVDLDGDLDLFHLNGWPEARNPEVPMRFNNSPARLFENRPGNVFVDVAAAAGADNTGQGRGALMFDMDNDGDLDIFLINNQVLTVVEPDPIREPAPPALLRNDSVHSNRWMKVLLEGTPPRHRNGIGSRVYLTAGGTTQMRELDASTGFMAHGPGRIAHFGLGTNASAAEIRAEWLGGEVVRRFQVEANQQITLPSANASISPRSCVAGEPVQLSAASILDTGQVGHWVVNGQTHADPATVFFITPGMHEVRLDVYAATGGSLIRQELYPVTVRPFLMTGVAMQPDGVSVVLEWESWPGRTYRVDHCADVAVPVWLPASPEYTVPPAGGNSLIVTNPALSGFYRVELLR